VKRAVLVGTISNAAGNLRSDLSRVINAMSTLDLMQIFLVESDSKDATLSILEELRQEVENFTFVSLGDLRLEIPDRIHRIRYCRNVYVQEIRNILKTSDLDFVVVADLDGMNSRISSAAVQSSFNRDDWGAVLANQRGGYYDVLALRHPTWCPQDVLVDLRNEQSLIDKTSLPWKSLIRRTRRRVAYDHARKKAIYSKMIKIKHNEDWIEVNSGFGGLGIYKAKVFKSFDYSLLDGDLDFESEHVALSKRMIGDGQKIFINPRMINNNFNTYNLNRFLLVRQLREMYWNSGLRFKKLPKSEVGT
jgi:glycosyltransferase involved in cell wall biosynthesis